MYKIVQGETTTVTVDLLPDWEVTAALISLSQNGEAVVSYTEADANVAIGDDTVTCTFTQADTNGLNPKYEGAINVALKLADGSRPGIWPVPFCVLPFVPMEVI